MPEITCNFIDCCSPDYLSDHHNRENEALLCCCPNKDTEQIIEDLLACCEYIESTWNLDVAKVNQSVVNMVHSLPIDCLCPIDYSDSINSDDYSELYIYAYLSW